MEIQKSSIALGDAPVIRRYGPGFIVVNDETVTASVVVTPEGVRADWPPQSYIELAAEHCTILAAHKADVILLGTGSRQRFPPRAVMERLAASGAGFEIMGTAAACRTYNVLLNEGRRVVAGLLMIER